MILSVCPNPSVDIFADIDAFEIGKSNRIIQERLYPGGKGIHVALAARELGAESMLLGFWGGDTGAWLRRQCSDLGVSCIGPVIAGTSRRCYTFRSSNNKLSDTELLCPGPAVAKEEINEFFDAYERALEDCSVIALSGSWPAAELADSYGSMIKRARDSGRKVVLDASGAALRSALDFQPDAVHLNENEAKELTGMDSVSDMLDYFSNKVAIAAITCGADGLYIAQNELRLHASVAVDLVISSVGSGDCLVAGLVKALSEGQDLKSMARLAVACGAANCLRQELGMLHLEEVQRLLAQVEVREFVP